MRRTITLLAVTALALAGCGGGTSHPPEGGHPNLHSIAASRAAARLLTTATTAQTIAATPSGPPAPVSGWDVAYGDAFASPLGTAAGDDNTWSLDTNNKGCCGNSNELNIERPAMDSITSEGLQLRCEHLAAPIEGLSYDCGGISTSGTGRPKFAMGLGQTLAFQFVEKLPPTTGNADPASWLDGPPWGTTECDFPEFYPGHGNSYLTSPDYFACFASPHPNLVKWGASSTKPPANPDQALHTYTTYLYPVTGGYRYEVYVDGMLQKLQNEGTGCYSESCAASESPTIASFPSGEKLSLILTYALRSATGATGFTGSNAFTVRSAAVYEDNAHIGVGVEDGGVAPGTVVAGSKPPPPKEEPPVEPPPPPPSPKEQPPAAPSLTVSAIAGPKVQITVTPVSGATGYSLYRAGRNYPGHANGTPWATSSTPSFSNAYEVEHGMWLCYRATATNAAGSSAPSAPACLVVP